MSGAASLFAKAKEAFAANQDLDARLLVAAGLTALGEPLGIKPVVVGGTAVDFYAASTTPRGLERSTAIAGSQDLDVVAVGLYGDAATFRRALAVNGFTRVGAIPVDACRGWLLAGAGILVEVLGGDLAGSEDRVVAIEVDDGVAYLWGPEDTVWQYAENAWSMRERPAWERARVISATQELDWDYLEEIVAREGKPLAIIACLRRGSSYEELQEATYP